MIPHNIDLNINAITGSDSQSSPCDITGKTVHIIVKANPETQSPPQLSEPIYRKFFNKMQRFAMAISAHDEYIVASRGTGKSEGIDARFILRNVWAMPGSTGALISPTYAKAWGNTLPAICHALAEWGYIEGVHYYVGHKAPYSAGFAKPKRPPLREAWSNCFHFWNGTIMVVLSFNNGMSANSMSLDWVIGPEAKFLDFEKIKSEVNPANRGNRQYFDACPWHHSTLYSTDMPTSKMGRWILDKREEMSTDHINFIRQLYNEKLRLQRINPQTEYTLRKTKEIEKDLALARRYQRPIKPEKGKQYEYTVFYGEYDIFDNLEVVGEDYIWQMHREQPALIWQTAFMNQRLFRSANGFYSALNEDVHFYMPNDNGRLSSLGANWSKLEKSGCLGDGDLDFNAPLEIAFDANAAICSCCVGQRHGNQFRTLKSFYVKTPAKLPELVANVAAYYLPKMISNRDIIFYYDQTFVWETGSTSESYAKTINRIFSENRYDVTDVYIGQAPRHDWKHLQIDLGMKGDPSLLFPQFNALNNEFLKIAMEQTGVRMGKNGFEKDKTPEGTADTPDNPDEFKTHITDAWDTLYIGANFFAKDPTGSGSCISFSGR